MRWRKRKEQSRPAYFDFREPAVDYGDRGFNVDSFGDQVVVAYGLWGTGDPGQGFENQQAERRNRRTDTGRRNCFHVLFRAATRRFSLFSDFQVGRRACLETVYADQWEGFLTACIAGVALALFMMCFGCPLHSCVPRSGRYFYKT